MPRTLAQAIERVVNIELAGAPYAGLSDAITDLAEARRKLDGLEELNATIEARWKAYERATELTARFAGKWSATHERVLEVARFLAPAWEELERPNDGTYLTLDAVSEEIRAIVEDRTARTLEEASARIGELEASEAGAVAQADELEDKLHRAEAQNENLRRSLNGSLELAAQRAEVLDAIRILAEDTGDDPNAARAAIIEIERRIKALAQ